MNQLAYQVLGKADQPAVLLLHGFMSSNAQWLLNVERLAEVRRLVLVELWGHGNSPSPEQRSAFSIEAYNEQFEQIRAALEIDEWHVIGQSYGAGVVINYALAHPERVLSVVATNSRSAFGQLTAEQRSTDTADPLAGEFDVRALPYHPIHSRRFPETVKAALVESADRIPREAIRRGGELGGRLNCAATINELEMPLLITNGRYEKAFQPELAALLQRHPALQVVNLDGGHSVNIEAPEAFNEAVLTFQSAIQPD